MAIRKKIYTQLKSEDNTGFGANSNNSGDRFYNRNGKANIKKRGIRIPDRYSWYHTMIEMRLGKFLLLIFAIYIAINLVFAGAYYLVGIEHLAGIITGSPFKDFTEVFFFSTQTFTTVGYGRISPTGFLTSSIATFEAFLGLLNFAIATGLFYGRFSRPQAFLKFSHHALISPFKNGKALMFRMSPYKNNHLSEAEVKLTMAISVEENGTKSNKFYNLDIEISKVNALNLSWTIVHSINEKSPLYGFNETDISNTRIELLVFVKAFDEVFSNTVVARTSYIASEIIWGAKFKLMYHPAPDKMFTILDLRKLNEYDKADVEQSDET